MDMTGTMSTAFVKAGSHLSIVSEKCPYFPKALIAAHAQQWLTQRPQSRFVTTVANPSALPQTEARYRIAFSRSRQKRGPPFRIV